jgi:hypothetical protein
MKYSIPNVHIEVGVIQMYWFTANSCLDPDDFMTNYNYPKVWAGCPGDGGVIGGKPLHNQYCTEKGKWPEGTCSFFVCTCICTGPAVS